jgi:dTDP-4-amino-4,6-dideoxygalactose transaminase
MNSRLDEVQAALLRIKLRSVEQNIAARQAVAHQYEERLSLLGIKCPAVPGDGVHAFNLYTIRCASRDAVRQALMDNGIGSSTCYPAPLALQKVYQHLGYTADDFPVAVALGDEVVSLPIYPAMTEAQVVRVCEVVENAVT